MIKVVRRHRKPTKLDRAIGMGRRVSEKKLSAIRKFLDEEAKKEDKLKSAAIKRYAKRHGLALSYHRKPWYLTRDNGNTIELAAGYYVTVDNVLQRIVAT